MLFNIYTVSNLFLLDLAKKMSHDAVPLLEFWNTNFLFK